MSYIASQAESAAIVTCVWRAGAVLGEGPCWDARSGRLFWVDIKGARILAFRPSDGARTSWSPPCRICSLDVPAPGWSPPPALAGDAFVGCGDLGLTWIGIADDRIETLPIVHPEADRPENRFNDGKMGPDGRYWAGTMDDCEEGSSGSLYAFRPDGSWTLLDDGYRVPNGPAFSPDGSVVYHTDSARQVIHAFDLQPGGDLANKRDFVRFGEGEGYPDGMTTDAQGGLWVAMWDGARIERISPAGERLGAIAMPTSRPSSCTFAQSGFSELFVTSASIDLDRQDSLAGGLFRLRMNLLENSNFNVLRPRSVDHAP